MSHLIAREDWADGRGPEAIAYFCGALPGGHRNGSGGGTTRRAGQRG